MNYLNLCTPALVYLVISVMSILVMAFMSFSILTLFIKALFSIMWAWVLNWTCTKGYTGISWVLVLMPYIFVISTMLIALEIMAVGTSMTAKIPLITRNSTTPSK